MLFFLPALMLFAVMVVRQFLEVISESRSDRVKDTVGNLRIRRRPFSRGLRSPYVDQKLASRGLPLGTAIRLPGYILDS